MNLKNVLQGRVSKYILSGVIATSAALAALVFFREVVGLWYLYSSTIAFLVGFTSSFLLQKFWTFNEPTNSGAHKQLMWFLIVSLINLVINGVGMYVFVDVFGIWYFLSQVCVTTFIAVWSFFAYRVIFQSNTSPAQNDEPAF